MKVITAFILLALFVAFTFVAIQVAFDGEIPGWSTQAATEEEDPGSLYGQSGIPKPGQAPFDAPEVADSTDEETSVETLEPPKVRERTFYYDGILFEALRPFGGQELTVQARVGQPDEKSRKIYTRPKSGEFVLTLLESEFPARLADSNNETLLRLETPPAAERLRLNVHLERPAWGRIMTATVITAIQTEDSCKVIVYGQTELDPTQDNQLISRLSCGGKIISESLWPVDGEAVIGELELYGALPFSGDYRFDLVWRPGEATATQTLALQDKGLLRSSQGPEIMSKTKLFLGRKDEEKKQDDEIAAYYDKAVRDCRMIRLLVSEVAIKFRGERLKVSERDRERVRSYPLYATIARLTSSSTFSTKRWRKFVDDDCQRVFAKYTDDQVPYPQKHPAMSRKVVQLFKKLNRFMRLESQLLYGAMQKKPDKKDYVNREFPTDVQWGMDKLALDKFLAEFEKLNRKRARAM